MGCQVYSVKCGVYSVERKVLKCGVPSVKCSV